MLLFLLSLTGIPPLAGFWAKAYVILAAVEAGGWLTVLAVLVVLNAALAAFYYLRVAVYMYMRDPESDAPPLSHGALLWGGLAAATGPDDPDSGSCRPRCCRSPREPRPPSPHLPS
jgi:NADH:ubiquinone oxidoreductase subunit 2 (subunit N)